jgi:hypothetical protein
MNLTVITVIREVKQMKYSTLSKFLTVISTVIL